MLGISEQVYTIHVWTTISLSECSIRHQMFKPSSYTDTITYIFPFYYTLYNIIMIH